MNVDHIITRKDDVLYLSDVEHIYVEAKVIGFRSRGGFKLLILTVDGLKGYAALAAPRGYENVKSNKIRISVKFDVEYYVYCEDIG